MAMPMVAVAVCRIWAAWAFKLCFQKRPQTRKGPRERGPFFMEKSVTDGSEKNIVGAGAAFDGGGAQPVNIKMMADHFQQP